MMRKKFADWLAYRAASTTESSRAAYLHALQPWFRWMEQRGYGIPEISNKTMTSYILDARAAGLSNNTIAYKVMLVRSFLGWLVDEEELEVNPLVGRKLPALPSSEPDTVPFTHEEYERIIAELRREDRVPVYGLELKEIRRPAYRDWWVPTCQIGWHTGLRISDIAGLKWSSVDFERELLTVRPKKKAARREILEIPMEPELVRIMLGLWERRIPNNQYVLPILAGYYQDKARKMVVHWFRLACDRCGFKRHSFHSFRHGFVTRLLNAGVDPITIGSMTGQSLSTITSYAHVSNEAKVVALQKSREALHSARLVEMKMLVAS